jgi:hypothetical protein
MVNIFRSKVIQRELYKGKLKDDINRIQDLRHTIQGFTKEFIDKITKWEYTGKLRILSVELPIYSLTEYKKFNMQHSVKL